MNLKSQKAELKIVQKNQRKIEKRSKICKKIEKSKKYESEIVVQGLGRVYPKCLGGREITPEIINSFWNCCERQFWPILDSTNFT